MFLPRHKRNRLLRARSCSNWSTDDWIWVLFTDESNSSSNSDNGRQVVYRKQRHGLDSRNFQQLIDSLGKSIMLWCGFSAILRTRPILHFDIRQSWCPQLFCQRAKREIEPFLLIKSDVILYLLHIKFNILNIQIQRDYFQIQHMESQLQHENFLIQPGLFSGLLTFQFNSSLSKLTHSKLVAIIEENHS